MGDPQGISEFRFELEEDIYYRELGLRWAQIPLDMENIPQNVDCILCMDLQILYRPSPFVTLIPYNIPFRFNMNTFKTLGNNTNDLPDYEEYIQLNPNQSPPNFNDGNTLCQILNNYLTYVLNHLPDFDALDGTPFAVTVPPWFLAYTQPALPAAPIPYPFFVFNQHLNSVTFQTPTDFAFEGQAIPANTYAFLGNIKLSFGFIVKGLLLSSLEYGPIGGVGVAGVAIGWQGPPIPAQQAGPPTAEQVLSAVRFATVNLGLPNRIPMTTNSGANPLLSTSSFDQAFFLRVISDTLYQVQPVDPNLPFGQFTHPLQQQNTFTTSPLSWSFNNGAPNYFLLKSNLMQTSKIKPMISHNHAPNSFLASHFPLQYALTRSATQASAETLAVIPLQINAVQTFGNVYLYRNDQEWNHPHEMTPTRVRSVTLRLCYPDGSPVFFRSQFPVFSLNLKDF